MRYSKRIFLLAEVFKCILIGWQDLWIPYYCVTTDITDSKIRIHRAGMFNNSISCRAVHFSQCLLVWLKKDVLMLLVKRPFCYSTQCTTATINHPSHLIYSIFSVYTPMNSDLWPSGFGILYIRKFPLARQYQILYYYYYEMY